jgi:hypothetical protein
MLLPAFNPKVVDGKDGYLVIVTEDVNTFPPESRTWRVVESQPTEEKALKAARILQEHEDAHNINIYRSRFEVRTYDIRPMLAYTQRGMLNEVR